MLPDLTVVNVFSWWLGWAGRSAVAVGAGCWLAYLGSLILQQAGPGFLTLWPQEAVPKAQVLEFTQHHFHHVLLTKASQGQLRPKRWGNWLYLLIGGAAKYCSHVYVRAQ